MSRKLKNNYSTPSHPWRIDRIKAENDLMKKYGLRRKIEIWRMNYIINNFKSQAKSLVAKKDESAKVTAQNLFARLNRLGILKGDISFDDILALRLEDILERRLQTIVVRSGLARTMRQSRQMIVHEHIAVNGKVITSPSYLVKVSEEASLGYSLRSPFTNSEHPELNIATGKPVVDSESNNEVEETQKDETKKEAKENSVVKRDLKNRRSRSKTGVKKKVKEVA